jgi:hypothetical protein
VSLRIATALRTKATESKIPIFPRFAAFLEWRGPNSNRGHHDFQGDDRATPPFLKEGVRVLSRALIETEAEEHVGAPRHERAHGGQERVENRAGRFTHLTGHVQTGC